MNTTTASFFRRGTSPDRAQGPRELRGQEATAPYLREKWSVTVNENNQNGHINQFYMYIYIYINQVSSQIMSISYVYI